MLKAVIFDFGGVVVDVAHTGSMDLIIKTLNVDPIISEPIIGKHIARMSVGEITEDEFWQEISRELDRPIPDDWMVLWRKPLEENAVLWKEIVDLVSDLKKKKLLTLVLSNTIPPHEQLVRSWGWYDYFDRTYFSNNIGLRKPDIKAYEYVLQKEALTGTDCVFIDDTQENLLPARDLGMRTVWARNPKQVVNDVRQLLA